MDDFNDLCDPADVAEIDLSTPAYSSYVIYVKRKVARDTDITQFWMENKSILPKLFRL